MALQIYNTLTGKKEEFVPLEPGRIRMYVCGITVYDFCHIGHARSAIVFDVIYRFLTSLGYQVSYVRNFTDIDDKILRRAASEGVDYKTIADRFIGSFHEDMEALGLLPPTMEPLATEHISEMIEIVRRLVEKGVAYKAGTDVYFSVELFSGYGKLSGRDLVDMVAGARVEVDENKRNPMDFVLWKGSKPGEPFWESPWGPGRPGWHIECSAMARKYLGATIDLHGGGKDLVFPHHENEIAQAEAAFDTPFVRYWIHNGFVNINNEKMSKSLGNFITIRDVLESVHPESLRLFVISKHYRSPVDFCDETVGEAERGLERLYATVETALEKTAKEGGADYPADELKRQDGELYEKLDSLSALIAEAMENDFNTAQAVGYIFTLQRNLQRFLDKSGRKDLKGAAARLAAMAADSLVRHCRAMGLLMVAPEVFFDRQRRLKLKATGMSEDELNDLIALRHQARVEKNFAESDRIRKELEKRRIQLEDTPKGTKWRVSLLQPPNE
ncbi:MAG: cysteine--tRNA ligase [Syntrophobacteraceae bacterium]|nr:cysteine--tRNA ligase [Syntrophobacteraceae bacterium]